MGKKKEQLPYTRMGAKLKRQDTHYPAGEGNVTYARGGGKKPGIVMKKRPDSQIKSSSGTVANMWLAEKPMLAKLWKNKGYKRNPFAGHPQLGEHPPPEFDSREGVLRLLDWVERKNPTQGKYRQYKKQFWHNNRGQIKHMEILKQPKVEPSITKNKRTKKTTATTSPKKTPPSSSGYFFNPISPSTPKKQKTPSPKKQKTPSPSPNGDWDEGSFVFPPTPASSTPLSSRSVKSPKTPPSAGNTPTPNFFSPRKMPTKAKPVNRRLSFSPKSPIAKKPKTPRKKKGEGGVSAKGKKSPDVGRYIREGEPTGRAVSHEEVENIMKGKNAHERNPQDFRDVIHSIMARQFPAAAESAVSGLVGPSLGETAGQIAGQIAGEATKQVVNNIQNLVRKKPKPT